LKANDNQVAEIFVAEARKNFDRYLHRIERCLSMLSEREIWWRPNPASNSAGNIVLHLCGNMRQWIISGLGGAPDVRERDKEFAERGPISRRELVALLRATVKEASRVMGRIPPQSLARKYTIQGYRVRGLGAAAQVHEHFSHHAGQIIYITKMKRGRDLRFTRLPRIKKRK
jgi:hypothetical protein